jgi:DNA uptake protein ComE-like DNA-binding protein
VTGDPAPAAMRPKKRAKARAKRRAKPRSLPLTRRSTAKPAAQTPKDGNEELSARVASLEKEIKQLGAAVKKLADAPPKPARKKAPKAKAPAKRTRRTKPDINTISYEELRKLGLTTTQAARLIAARETRGRFKDLDQLDELRGFPAETLAALKSKVRLGR